MRKKPSHSAEKATHDSRVLVQLQCEAAPDASTEWIPAKAVLAHRRIGRCRCRTHARTHTRHTHDTHTRHTRHAHDTHTRHAHTTHDADTRHKQTTHRHTTHTHTNDTRHNTHTHDTHTIVGVYPLSTAHRTFVCITDPSSKKKKKTRLETCFTPQPMPCPGCLSANVISNCWLDPGKRHTPQICAFQ